MLYGCYIHYKDYAQYDLFDWCVFKIDNQHVFGRSSVLACQNFNIEIYSDTINVINVKLCMVALLTELYLLIPFSVTVTILQDHSSIEQF